MVTQLYTVPLRPYNPRSLGINALSVSGKKTDENLHPDPEEKKEEHSATLNVMKEHSKNGVISVEAIVSDFRQTMDALGVPSDMREEILPYFQVVSHQSQKPQPASGLIKQNLRGAAETLDQFISQSLGQKSSVVREWVDALLLQPVDFHSSKPIAIDFNSIDSLQVEYNNPGVSTKKQAMNLLQQDEPVLANLLSNESIARIKLELGNAREAEKDNQPEKALSCYRNILEDMQGVGVFDLKGKIYYRMGKIMQKSSNLDDAKTCYEEASNCFKQMHEPARLHAKTHQAMAKIFRQEKNLDEAGRHLKQSLEISEQLDDETGKGKILSILGENSLAAGKTDEAKQYFKEALPILKASNLPVTSRVLTNLGTISRQEGKRKESFAFYKESLLEAQRHNDYFGVKHSLQNIASVYLDIGKPEKAIKILEKALQAS